MLLPKLVFAVLSCATLMGAQNLPAGTALPIALNSTLNAKSDKPAQKIGGTLKQEVRLPSGVIIKSGSHVTGHVVSVSKPGANGSAIVVQFDQLQVEHQAIPLNVSVRAVAGSESVFKAGLPAGNSTAGDPSDSWVTQQVGGEYVFRGRGYVASDQGKVGVWDGRGVWGKLQSAENCEDSEINGDIQALWVFSTTACGAHGLPDTTLIHAGNTPPLGQVTLQSTKNVEIRGGSGWLLLVNGESAKANSK
jgi:hypothetical protein